MPAQRAPTPRVSSDSGALDLSAFMEDTPARALPAQGRSPPPRANSTGSIEVDRELEAYLAELSPGAADTDGAQPMMLDDSALSAVGHDDQDLLDSVTDPGDSMPEPLSASALQAIDPEPLSDSALRTLDPEPEPEPQEEIPLLDGFEATRLDADLDRSRGRERAQPAPSREFSYQTCPQCNAPQPQPSPPFCESCGQRLKRPGGKSGARAADDARVKRCGECGIRNREDASNCSNCGSRLRT
jgi:hypothetical protein